MHVEPFKRQYNVHVVSYHAYLKPVSKGTVLWCDSTCTSWHTCALYMYSQVNYYDASMQDELPSSASPPPVLQRVGVGELAAGTHAKSSCHASK